MKLSYVHTILLIILIVLLTLNTFVCNKKQELPKIDEKLHEKYREDIRAIFDEKIEGLRARDSVYVIEHKNTIIKFEKIPDRINALNRDSLRRAVTDF